MRPVVGTNLMGAFDKAWSEAGVPGLILMENAGRGAAHLIGLKARPRPPGQSPRPGSELAGSCIRCADERALSGLKVLVFCGYGNNGGDGFVVARHLAMRGAHVKVYGLCSFEKLKGDAATMAQAYLALGSEILEVPPAGELDDLVQGADLLVDALLGTGLSREPKGSLNSLIEAINLGETQVISLDVPSGLCAQTGATPGAVIQAAHTVVFGHLKKGLLTPRGHEVAGSMTLSSLGVPPSFPHGRNCDGYLLEKSDLARLFKPRSPRTHKGEAGRVVITAGSEGTLGAARLAARGSLRAGAGLVTISSSTEVVEKLDLLLVEPMTSRWGPHTAALLEQAGALVVGPGLGKSEQATKAIVRVLQVGIPTVLDADALRWLATKKISDVAGASENLWVLTPHPGEAAALLGVSIAEVESDRWNAVSRLAQLYHCVVVLKGSRTLIAAPGAIPCVCAFGSAAMATAGSGDVLAGIIGSFLVGAKNLLQVSKAAQLGVCVHALAGQSWEKSHGERGLLASEIADLVPDVLKEIRAQSP